MANWFKVIFEILGDYVFTISYGVTEKTLALHFKPAFKGRVSDKAGTFAEKLFEAVWEKIGIPFGCVSKFPRATISAANGEFVIKLFRPLEDLRYYSIVGINYKHWQPFTHEFRQAIDCYAIYASAFGGLSRAEYLLVRTLEVLEKMAPQKGRIIYCLEKEGDAYLIGSDAEKATKTSLRRLGYPRFKKVGDGHHAAFLGYGLKEQMAMFFLEDNPGENQREGWRLLIKKPFVSPQDLIHNL